MTHILIVEDSPMQAHWLASILRDDGYDVDIAPEAERAFEKLSLTRHDLLLTDLQLPGESGIDLCRRVRQTPFLAATPVILITGWADPINALRGLEVGVDSVIVKGGTPQSILDKLRNVLTEERAVETDSTLSTIRFEFCGERFEVPNNQDRLWSVLLATFASVYDLSQQHQQNLQDRERVEAELRAAHDALEARVRDRTQNFQEYATRLSQSNSEICHRLHLITRRIHAQVQILDSLACQFRELATRGKSQIGADALLQMEAACNQLRNLCGELVTGTYGAAGGEQPTAGLATARPVEFP